MTRVASRTKTWWSRSPCRGAHQTWWRQLRWNSSRQTCRSTAAACRGVCRRGGGRGEGRTQTDDLTRIVRLKMEEGVCRCQW